MDHEDKKKYALFAVLAVIFLAGSAYYSSSQSAQIYSVPSIQEMRAKTMNEPKVASSGWEWDFSLPSFGEDDTNRITNENCGISFKIPESWSVTRTQEGERYCRYDIKNPNKRGASLVVGVPDFLYPQDTVEWTAVIDEVEKSLVLRSASIPHADESLRSSRTEFPPDNQNGLIGVSYPMYVFRKGQAVYFMRYGYADDDGRDMLEDISSVMSSVRFPNESSFYDAPLRLSP